MDVRARVRTTPQPTAAPASSPAPVPIPQPASTPTQPTTPAAPSAAPTPTNLPVHEPPKSDDAPTQATNSEQNTPEAPAQQDMAIEAEVPQAAQKQQTNNVPVAGIIVGTLTVMLILIALTIAVYIQS